MRGFKRSKEIGPGNSEPTLLASEPANDSINGLIVEGENPVAKIVDNEVFSISTGEKVGFMRDGYLCSLEGERLASFDALSSTGEGLSERVQKLLKL